MLCARGGRDSIISEQPGVVLAVHQDDFSGLTCISYRLSLGCSTSSCCTYSIIPPHILLRNASYAAGMLHGALHRFIALALLHLNSDTNLGTSLGCSTSRAAQNTMCTWWLKVQIKVQDYRIVQDFCGCCACVVGRNEKAFFV